MIEYDMNIEEVKSSFLKFTQKIDKDEAIDLKDNIFAILRIQDVEIRHSNFLAWLMDKNINGKVGSKFLYLFLKEIYKNSNLSKDLVNSNYSVVREYKDGLEGRSADIFIKFEKYKRIILIENKVYSTESENQLKDYYKGIEKVFSDTDGYHKTYVYLTLNGEKPENTEDQTHWQTFSYGQILKILNKIKTDNTKHNVSVIDMLIANYIDILKDKTEKVMDRKKEYWKLYTDKNNKNMQRIMNEMVEFLPRYEERAKLIKDTLKQNNISLFSENSRAFLDFYIPQIQNALIEKNIDSEFFYCEIGNNSSFNKCVLSFLIKLKDKKYEEEFYKDFRMEFNKRGYKEKKSKADYRLLITVPLMNRMEDSADELTKQREIQENLNNIINNNGFDVVNNIVEYIRKYDFKM